MGQEYVRGIYHIAAGCGPTIVEIGLLNLVILTSQGHMTSSVT